MYGRFTGFRVSPCCTFTILGFIRGCGGNRLDIGSELPSKEYPIMAFGNEIMDTLLLLQQVSESSECIYERL